MGLTTLYHIPGTLRKSEYRKINHADVAGSPGKKGDFGFRATLKDGKILNGYYEPQCTCGRHH